MSRTAGRLARWGAAAAAAASLLGGAPTAATATQPSLTEGQWWRSQWAMDDVWELSQGSGVTVAVLDTGVDASVPELAGAVLSGTNLVGTGGDGDTDHDPEGHGTQMASLIAGHGGDQGFRGVAPAATILPVTVFDRQRPDVDEFDEPGIRYAVDNGAQVINISLTTPGFCRQSYLEALRYAADHDVIVVAGSGNEPGGRSGYPGSCPGVLTVGATDRRLDPWQDSHRSDHVDVAAAGVEVSTMGPGGQALVGTGTSYSAALVSGVAALLRAQYPDASADEVLRRILYTAGDVDPAGRDDATGFGMVQPLAALTEPVPPDAPNSVYQRLDSATSDRTGPASTAPPGLAAAPPTDNGPQPLFVGGAVLVVALISGLLLVAIRHARRPPRRPVPYRPPPPRRW